MGGTVCYLEEIDKLSNLAEYLSDVKEASELLGGYRL